MDAVNNIIKTDITGLTATIIPHFIMLEHSPAHGQSKGCVVKAIKGKRVGNEYIVSKSTEKATGNARRVVKILEI